MQMRKGFIGQARPDRAMSLLEIMVVVVIMGIIAGIVMKMVTDRVTRANVTKAKVELASLRDAVNMFFVDHSFYPESLRDLVSQPADERIKDWPPNGYMPSIPLDPWGNEYIYVMPGLSRSFEIICLGADGVEGGEGADADIESWNLSPSVGGPP